MHDVVIIGAGPGGLSAAFWCDELGLDTLVVEQAEQIGGQLHRVYNPIGNYLGLKTRNGEELFELFSRDVDEADFDLWTGAVIDSVDLRAKRISLRSGETLQAISIVIATGVRPRLLGIPGENEFSGVIESGARDRDLFAGKDVCIIGGGDAAVENALLLAEVCATVTLVHRGRKLRARREFAERVQPNNRITVFTESVVTRIIGGDTGAVEAVEIQRKGGLKPFQLAVRGVLIRIGVEPNTELFRDQLAVDEKGYVTVNSEQETSVPMVFAIGDVANPIAPTISGATGAGATAAKVIAARLNRKADG
ncbi:MAG TPA: NAD(P)/FAD-dependent oxidoreductase [Pyrinomonadaceae bacterium]|nr:NAD(P)/FAD-dependent oxidoreductase [Pyrinomonadaceae bacterium]